MMDKYTFLKQNSLPITLKRLVPPVPCVAFLYSEDQLAVFHLFESDTLLQSVESGETAEITKALTYDTNARIGWIGCKSSSGKRRLLDIYANQFGSAFLHYDKAA